MDNYNYIDLNNYNYPLSIYRKDDFKKAILKTNILELSCVEFEKGSIFVSRMINNYIGINLGTKIRMYQINSHGKKHKIYAYNEKEKTITFKINCFLRNNINNKRYKIIDGVLTFILTDKGHKIVIEGLKRMEEENRIPKNIRYRRKKRCIIK